MLLHFIVHLSLACLDDPKGWLWKSGATCEGLTQNGTELSVCWEQLSKHILQAPSSMMIGEVCRKSCYNCPWWEGGGECVDAPQCGVLLEANACDAIVANGTVNTTVNALCRKTCQNCPTPPHPASSQCLDDPEGILPPDQDCASLTAAYGCGSFSNADNSVWTFCRATCGACTPQDPAYCRDSDMSAYGTDCGKLAFNFGCKYDFHADNASLPKGSLVSNYCKNTCGACPPRQGNAQHCRAFRANPYYQYSTGTTELSYRDWMGSLIKGGWYGDTGSCYELGRQVSDGSRFCSVFQSLFICVPAACGSDDLKDFFRELSNGYFYDDVTVTCEGEGPGLSIGFAVSVALSGVLLALVCVGSCSGRWRLVACWDVQRSMDSLLLSRGSATGFLDCVRTISVLWIVLGHSYFFYSISPRFSNPSYELDRLAAVPSAPVVSTELAVDTFFYMSGLLGTSIFLSVVAKSPKKFNTMGRAARSIALSSVLRYLRIVPLMGYTMLMGTLVVPHMGSGPYWDTYRWNLMLPPSSDVCEKYWWRNVLMIANLFDWPDEMCFGWLWYLSVDFQYSVALPFLLLPYVKLGKNLRAVAVAVLVALIMLNMALGYFMHLTRTDSTYVRPHLRMAPYLYGVLSGICLANINEHNGWEWVPCRRSAQDEKESMSQPLHDSDSDETPQAQPKMSRIRVVCYTTSCALLLSAVYILFKRESNEELHTPWSKANYDLFNIYYLFSWGLGLSLLCIPFAMGHGGVVRRAMSHPMWNPLGKLSYGVYLVHPLVIYAAAAATGGPVRYTDYGVVWNWCASAVISFVISLLLWVIVESPCSLLLGVVRKGFSQKPEHKNQADLRESAALEEVELVSLDFTFDGTDPHLAE